MQLGEVMNVDAVKLFNQSRLAGRTKGYEDAHWSQICGYLRRASLTHKGTYEPNPESVFESVRTGDIWNVRGIGAKSVYRICEWLTEKGYTLDD